MMRDDRPTELHTEAEDDEPLAPDEAGAMGNQTVRTMRGVPEKRELVYGDVGVGPENEDETDAHHADPDEHV